MGNWGKERREKEGQKRVLRGLRAATNAVGDGVPCLVKVLIFLAISTGLSFQSSGILSPCFVGVINVMPWSSGQMDSRRSPANEYGQRVSLSIASLLVSAVLEWILIFLLFIDANFSYLVTRFARYCQLQIPCLLCSRLDHVLGSERSGFYWDLICHKHKLKISSLVLCKLHDNLVDVHGTCESCLFSFATVNKTNAETYRLLVGKLGAEPYFGLAEGATSDDNGSSGTRICTCCNEQLISRTYTESLFQGKSTDYEGAELDPSVTSKYNVDEVQEITERSSQLGQKWSKDADLLPHVEYSKVKVTSDTESEGPFSDNENENALIRETETSAEDSEGEYVYMEPQIITLVDCPAPEKSIDPAQPTDFLLTESGDPTTSGRNVEPEASVGHGLEELNRKQPDHKNGASEPSELISSSEALPSPNISGTHYYESKETNDTSSTQMEKVAHVECGEASNLASDSAGTAELWKEVAMEHEDTLRIGNEPVQAGEIQMDLKPIKIDSLQMSESLDLGAAYKLALGIRGRQLSGRLLEQQRSMKESLRASEDLKVLLSQISSRGIELPLSPRVSANSEDFKAMDASIAAGMQIIQRRISLERNESTLSLDGSTISEIEGESVEDRLKRQVEHDKKMMSTLYKELEEERNAAAIAANQSMAMITRLQEEKAALHMEALQCLRMMDEQAEHDDEALQQANDLLTDKEKQIQDLEYELELYKNQFGDISLPNTCVKPRLESDAGVLKAQKIEANYEEKNMTAFSNSDKDKHEISNKIDGAPKALDREMATGRISLPQFEDEKQFILQCLKKLEEKLYMFAKHDIYSDMIDNASSTAEVLKASAADQLDSVGVSQENGRTNNNLPTDAVMHKETPSKDLCGNENESEGYGEFKSGQNVNKDAELDALRHELSVMNNRLEALEAEKNVVECSINSLEKGSEGFELIREIVVRLQELHSVHNKTRNEDLT
ncbi:putative myosin-binding protein 4 [Sesamum alatum]|uniref:Myosin-binding protein 4 n=1 Tax=Sesamum alatum TaxID=300844 RepID=A0AAE2CMT5_9LAMI|nr:putative myosin-binding protein 4 [Sesamum alatum]